MHIHILGICGTFMGGLALLARAAGHKVTGCDAGVYPPMSTQLQEQGIGLIEGYGTEQLSLQPDLFVVGNVVSRGNPLMEEILNQGLPYTSGPAWLAEHILQGKWVLAVAGTHGKTTTSSMLAWILQECGYAPGFLIGGVAQNFGISARLGVASESKTQEISNFFVIEADEYDTAFFDKRSKFVHYRPKTVILNNLEFDHADIFPDLAAIQTQFHHLVRTVPNIGALVVNFDEPNLKPVLERGAWSTILGFATFVENGSAEWQLRPNEKGCVLLHKGKELGMLEWSLTGKHNQLNALAAVAAAHHVGVPAEAAIVALAKFEGVKRRMEIRGVVNNITVYDDFAHHPTAIATTLEGLRKKMQSEKLNANNRILAVIEPRSNTMKLGVMKAALPKSLESADLVFGHAPTQGKDALGWDLQAALAPLGARAQIGTSVENLVEQICQIAQSGDQIVVMSNGGFGGIHEKILKKLAK